MNPILAISDAVVHEGTLVVLALINLYGLRLLHSVRQGVDGLSDKRANSARKTGFDEGIEAQRVVSGKDPKPTQTEVQAQAPPSPGDSQPPI